MISSALFCNSHVFDTGYVLSCLPFMSEDHLKINEQIELIKNLKLTPDIIINIKVTVILYLELSIAFDFFSFA